MIKKDILLRHFSNEFICDFQIKIHKFQIFSSFLIIFTVIQDYQPINKTQFINQQRFSIQHLIKFFSNMGPANQPVSRQTQQELSLQKIPSKHPRLVNAQLCRSKDQRQFLQAAQSIGNILAYNSWEANLEQIKKKIGSNSMYLPFQCSYEQQSLCGTAGILKLKLDYYPFLLDQEISTRQQTNMPFEQKQIWFLLYILVQTAAASHSIGLTVGDIRPSNIFINEDGDISVYSMFTFPEQFNNFQKVRYFKQANYIPPQGVNDIKTSKQTPTYDQKVGQSFSIGLTILDAIFLTDHSFLYDKMQRFNQIALAKILETLKNLEFNQKLKSIIISLLSMNPDKRLSCEELYNHLKPFEKQIFELEPFQIPAQFKSQQKSQKSKSNSIQVSRLRSEGKVAAKTKRQNLIRYSLGRSDKKNIIDDLAQKQKFNQQNNKDQPISNKKYNALCQNYSALAEQPSTLKKVQDFEQPIKQYSKDRSANNFEQIEVQNGNFRQKYMKNNEEPKVLQIEGKQSNITYHNHNNMRQNELVFKTGNLFHKERQSAPILDGLRLQQIQNIGYQNFKYEMARPSQGYKYEQSFQRTQLMPSVDNSMTPQSTTGDYSDFLKQIDKQIEESKRLFPDSFK